MLMAIYWIFMWLRSSFQHSGFGVVLDFGANEMFDPGLTPNLRWIAPDFHQSQSCQTVKLHQSQSCNENPQIMDWREKNLPEKQIFESIDFGGDGTDVIVKCTAWHTHCGDRVHFWISLQKEKLHHLWMWSHHQRIAVIDDDNDFVFFSLPRLSLAALYRWWVGEANFTLFRLWPIWLPWWLPLQN